MIGNRYDVRIKRPSSNEILAFLRQLIVFAFCLSLVVKGGSLGFSEVTDKHSADIANLTIEMASSIFGFSDIHKSVNRLLVVTIDDDALRSKRQNYPPDHSFHARILNSIIAKRPRAIMLDITFEAERNGTGELVSALQAAANSDIPVYFAVRRSTSDKDRHTLPQIEALGTAVDVQRSADPLHAETYCLLPAATMGELCWSEPEEGGSPTAPRSPPTAGLSAAFQIYADLCGRRHDPICGDADGKFPEPVAWPLRSYDFDILWHYAQAAPREGTDEVSCDDPGSESGAVAPLRIWPMLRRFVSDGPDGLRALCPPIPSVSATAFLAEGRPYLKLLPAKGSMPSGERNDKAVAEGPARLRSLVAKKIVFYGFGLDNSTDIVRPPTHNTLPGVYFHAMALENLLSSGNDYKSDIANLFNGWTISIDTINVSLFILVYMFILYSTQLPQGDQGRVAVFIRWISWWPLTLILLVSFGLLLTFVVDLAPVNWVGIFGLAALGPVQGDKMLRALGRGIMHVRHALIWLSRMLAHPARWLAPNPRQAPQDEKPVVKGSNG